MNPRIRRHACSLPVYLLPVVLGLVFSFGLLRAADTPPKKDDAVLLSPFVVTEKSRGIIPLNGWFRYNGITGTVKTPVIIGGTIVPGQTLEQYGVKKTERIVAVSGQRLAGMDKSDLVRLWMETGDAGDPIELTIQGSGEDATVFRKVLLKRVPPPKRSPKTADTSPAPTPAR